MVKALARLLAPDEFIDRVSDLVPQMLLVRGIHGLVLDLDNTICEWQSEVIPDDIREWLRRLNAAGIAVCLASNTHNRRRLQRVADSLGISYVQGLPKPRKRCFNKALQYLELPADRVAVVGDQMFTDVLGGKRSGIHTIMVKPLNSREFIGTKISRLFERALLCWFHKHKLLPNTIGSSVLEQNGG